MDDTVRKRAGQVLMGSLVVTLGHMGATQWFARGLVYNERFLGPEVFFDDKIGVKFYLPHKVWAWSLTYWGGYIDTLILQAVAGASSSVLLALLVVWLLGRMENVDVHRTAHGSSRWATEDEVRASEMVLTVEERLAAARKEGKRDDEACSVVLGKLEDGTLLLNSGKEFVLGNAPTRSGKGVGWVIPTLLTWAGSVLITDMKGENFQITGWWRSLFSHVIYFNPTDANSAKWNPLLEIRRGEESIQDAMNLGEILGSAAEEAGSKFWSSGAKKFLTATILYVLYTQEDKSLGKCIKLLARFEETFEAFAEVEIPDAPYIEEFVRSVADAAQTYSESVRGGWAAGAESALDLWRDPKVARNTATSDFRLRDLQYAPRPVSIYLVIPPPDLERLAPFVRLFFQQATDALTADGVEEAPGKKRLLMMMDEFPAFGRMEKVQTALGYTAGYGIKWFLIVQGLNQLAKRSLYGPENDFLGGCHTRLAYRCNDPGNAKAFCEMMGKTTGLKEQEAESGRKSALSSLSNRSVSQLQYERDLMTVGELQQMDSDRVLIMNAGENPIKAYKITYYDDPLFLPKFKGKRLGFPEQPLTDFPHQAPGVNPWHDALVEGLNDGDLHQNTLERDLAVKQARGGKTGTDVDWVDELPDEQRAQFRSGEAPDPLQDAKLEPREVESATKEIPAEMGPREAALHMTTSSLRSEDVNAMLERAVRAGILTQEDLDKMRAATAPRTPTEPVSPPEADEEPFDPFAHEQPFVVSDFDPFGEDMVEPTSEEPEESDLNAIFAQMGLPTHQETPEDKLEELMGTIRIPDMQAHLRELGVEAGDAPTDEENTP